MRRTLALRVFSLALSLATAPAFGWDVGFNFRATSGFVVDPSPTTWAIAGVTGYPTTRTIAGQVITFGWETMSPSLPGITRDRGTFAGPLIAGINCQSNDGSTSIFRVDLPSTGIYAVGLALGDGVGNNGMNNHAKIRSTTTDLFAVDANSVNNFADATGTLLSPLAWGSSNTMVQRTFGTTTFRLALGGTADSGLACLSHLRITLIQASQPAIAVPRNFILQ